MLSVMKLFRVEKKIQQVQLSTNVYQKDGLDLALICLIKSSTELVLPNAKAAVVFRVSCDALKHSARLEICDCKRPRLCESCFNK